MPLRSINAWASLSVSCATAESTHFTLDGETFELTPELVRARLEGHIPEDIREYWVEIDGVRWPVKQVISTATSVSNRRRFQSHDSRRWLQTCTFRSGKAVAPSLAAVHHGRHQLLVGRSTRATLRRWS